MEGAGVDNGVGSGRYHAARALQLRLAAMPPRQPEWRRSGEAAFDTTFIAMTCEACSRLHCLTG